MTDFDRDDIECARCRKLVPEDEAVAGTGPFWPMWFCPECAETLAEREMEQAA